LVVLGVLGLLGVGAGDPIPVEPELEPDPVLPDELDPVLGVLLELEPVLLPVLPEPLVLLLELAPY
jgi:hypothetical protein